MVSISSAVAISRSIIAGTSGGGFLGFFFFLPCFLTESTALIWRSIALRADGGTSSSRLTALAARTVPPRKRTAPRKMRALRSPGVPMQPTSGSGASLLSSLGHTSTLTVAASRFRVLWNGWNLSRVSRLALTVRPFSVLLWRSRTIDVTSIDRFASVQFLQ